MNLKSVSYAQTTNTNFQKLATRGVSVLIASGDSGARSRQSTDFVPEFPAALPACTAVGASVLNKNLTETEAVSEVFGWSSGGGFTLPKYFALNTSSPWQAEAVSHYFATATLPPFE